MAHTSPTVARWELALRLKRRREELQMSVKTITDHLGFSRNYWSMVENEKASLADDKFELLMELFDFDSATAAELDALRIEARKRSWWAELPGSDRLDEATQRFLGLERGAIQITNFEGVLVPGLLQTREYTRAYLESDPMFRQVDIENMTALRTRRQERFSEANSLSFIALLSEAVLHQQLGGREIWRGQLERLGELATSESLPIEIRILAFDNEPGPIVTASTLLLMTFESDHLPRVAWQEALRPLGIIDEPHELSRSRFVVEDGMKRCLNKGESVGLIESVLRAS